jgi:hypothetical protein
MFMKIAKAALLFTIASAVWAQVNVGEQKSETNVPFKLTTVATFGLPWRLAFLPVRLASLRHRPEHLSHLYRAG